MDRNLAYMLNLKDLTEANEEFFLVNENTGYDPYDNPGSPPENVPESD